MNMYVKFVYKLCI